MKYSFLFFVAAITVTSCNNQPAANAAKQSTIDSLNQALAAQRAADSMSHVTVQQQPAVQTTEERHHESYSHEHGESYNGDRTDRDRHDNQSPMAQPANMPNATPVQSQPVTVAPPPPPPPPAPDNRKKNWKAAVEGGAIGAAAGAVGGDLLEKNGKDKAKGAVMGGILGAAAGAGAGLLINNHKRKADTTQH